MFDIVQTAEIIRACENLLSRRRPPEEMRSKVDLAYRIEKTSVIIHTIRARWDGKPEPIISPVAKTTWIKSRKKWKIFWMRADLKWHSYKPEEFVNTIDEFIRIVDKDKFGCFWG